MSEGQTHEHNNSKTLRKTLAQHTGKRQERDGLNRKRVKIGANKTHEHRNTHALTHLRHTKHTLAEQHEYYQHTYKHTCDIKMHTM